MATVFERVRAIVVEQLGVEENEVALTSSFVDDLDADSLDLVELIMSLEEQFGEGSDMEISDEDFLGLLILAPSIKVSLADGNISFFEEVRLKRKARRFGWTLRSIKTGRFFCSAGGYKSAQKAMEAAAIALLEEKICE